ncbi:MAG: nucleotidyltransferase family protein [Candidatus Cloacimonetes bacterium]|nr:nucleotidyltransferase family protein [Candidatus Cloacimonadota bacterium]
MKKTEISKIIVSYLKDYDPKKIGIFGSFARNENDKESDIDILVDFRKKINLLDLVGIELDLSELLGLKVDLVTERSINPKLKKYIYKDLKVIYQ